MSSRDTFHNRHILRELNAAIRFTPAPLVVADRTKSFLNSLPNSTNGDGTTLAEFVANLPLHTIRDTTIEHMLSSDVLDVIGERDRLARLKEDAVAEQDFIVAKQFLDQEKEVLAEVKRLVPDPVLIEPAHIVTLLQALGFDGELTPIA